MNTLIPFSDAQKTCINDVCRAYAILLSLETGGDDRWIRPFEEELPLSRNSSQVNFRSQKMLCREADVETSH